MFTYIIKFSDGTCYFPGQKDFNTFAECWAAVVRYVEQFEKSEERKNKWIIQN